MATFSTVQASTAVNTSSTAFSFTFGAAPTAGNLIGVSVEANGAVGTLVENTGTYTAGALISTGSGQSARSMRTFWKIAGASESATVNFTLGSSATGRITSIERHSSTGYAATPNDVENAVANASGTYTSPSVTPAASVQRDVIAFIGLRQTSATWTGFSISGTNVGTVTQEINTSGMECLTATVSSTSGAYQATFGTPTTAAVNVAEIGIFAPAGGGTAATRDTASRLRIAAAAVLDAAARLRLRSATVYRDTASRLRLAASQVRDTGARLRVRGAASRDAVARFLLFGAGLRETSGRFRLHAAAGQPPSHLVNWALGPNTGATNFASPSPEAFSASFGTPWPGTMAVAASIQTTHAPAGGYALRLNGTNMADNVATSGQPSHYALSLADITFSNQYLPRYRSFRGHFVLPALPTSGGYSVAILAMSPSVISGAGIRWRLGFTPAGRIWALTVAPTPAGYVATTTFSTLAFTPDAAVHLLEVNATGPSLDISIDGVLYLSAPAAPELAAGICGRFLMGAFTTGDASEGTNATALDIYWRDCAWYGSEIDQLLYAVTGKDFAVAMLRPVSDNSAGSTTTGWFSGASNTASLFDAVDNTPPAGLLTPTNTSQIRTGSSALAVDYDANLAAYSTIALPSTGAIVAVQAVASKAAESLATANPELHLYLTANPVQAAPAAGSTGGGGYVPGTMEGSYDSAVTLTDFTAAASGWTPGFSVAVDTRASPPSGTPVLRVERIAGTYDTADVDALGLYVLFEYTPVPGAPILLSADISPLASRTTTGFSLTWHAPTVDDTHPAATGYRVTVWTDSTETTPQSGWDHVDVGNVLTYQITGVTPSADHLFWINVEAYNASGTGPLVNGDIRAPFYRDTSARARLQVSATGLRDATARFRLLAARTRDAVSRFRLRSVAVARDTIARLALRSATTLRDTGTRLALRSAAVYRDTLERLRLASPAAYRFTSTRARLAALVVRDAVARLRLVSPVTPRDTAARLRLSSPPASRDTAARARFLAGLTRDTAARFRLAILSYRLTATRFAVRSVLVLRDTTARVRLSALAYRDTTVRLRLVSPATYRDLAARFRQGSALLYRDTSARARLSALLARDTATRFTLVGAGIFRDTSARARLRAATLRDLPSRFRLGVGPFLRDTAARLRIAGLAARDTGGRFLLRLGQASRPVSDTTVGNWTTDAGATTGLYARVNEVVPDFAGYIQSPANPQAEAVTLHCGPLNDPGINTGYRIGIGYQVDTVGAVMNVQMDLIAGGVTFATRTFAAIPSNQTLDAVVLTSAEVDAMRANGGFGGFDVRFTATQTA